MWNGRFFSARYWNSRYWAKLGADAPEDACGTVTGTDVAHVNVTGAIADHQAAGRDTAYMSVVGGDEQCQ